MLFALSFSTVVVAEEESAKGVSSRCYVDEDNRLVVDGKPFFPLGFYGGRNTEELRRLAGERALPRRQYSGIIACVFCSGFAEQASPLALSGVGSLALL